LAQKTTKKKTVKTYSCIDFAQSRVHAKSVGPSELKFHRQDLKRAHVCGPFLTQSATLASGTESE
jgi:hypothetical protein